MAKYLPLPDGSTMEVDDSWDYATAMSKARTSYPDAFAPKPTPGSGFGAAASAGWENLMGDLAATKGKLGLTDIATAEKEVAAREQAARDKFQPTTDGWSESPWLKLKEAAGGAAPYMAAPLAAGVGAAAVGAPAALAAGAVSAGQFLGSNMTRSMGTGKSLEEVSLLNAAVAAPFQAALDVVGFRFIPGIRQIFSAAGKELAPAVAQKLFKDYAMSTGKAAGVEGATETGQQLLERLQAGLKITDEQARDEYFDSFVGGAVLGGALSPAGRYVERGQEATARREAQVKAGISEQKAATDAENARKATPEYAGEVRAAYAAAEKAKADLIASKRPITKGSPTETADREFNRGISAKLAETEKERKRLATEFNALPAEPAAPAAPEATPTAPEAAPAEPGTQPTLFDVEQRERTDVPPPPEPVPPQEQLYQAQQALAQHEASINALRDNVKRAAAEGDYAAVVRNSQQTDALRAQTPELEQAVKALTPRDPTKLQQKLLRAAEAGDTTTAARLAAQLQELQKGVPQAVPMDTIEQGADATQARENELAAQMSAGREQETARRAGVEGEVAGIRGMAERAGEPSVAREILNAQALAAQGQPKAEPVVRQETLLGEAETPGAVSDRNTAALVGQLASSITDPEVARIEQQIRELQREQIQQRSIGREDNVATLQARIAALQAQAKPNAEAPQTLARIEQLHSDLADAKNERDNALASRNREAAEKATDASTRIQQQLADLEKEPDSIGARVARARRDVDEYLNRFFDTAQELHGIEIARRLSKELAAAKRAKDDGEVGRLTAALARYTAPELRNNEQARRTAQELALAKKAGDAVEVNRLTVALARYTSDTSPRELAAQARQMTNKYIRAALHQENTRREAFRQPPMTAAQRTAFVDKTHSEAEALITRAGAQRGGDFKEEVVVQPAQMRSGKVIRPAVTEMRDLRSLEDRPLASFSAARGVFEEDLNNIRAGLAAPSTKTRVPGEFLKRQWSEVEAARNDSERGSDGSRRRLEYTQDTIDAAERAGADVTALRAAVDEFPVPQVIDVVLPLAEVGRTGRSPTPADLSRVAEAVALQRSAATDSQQNSLFSPDNAAAESKRLVAALTANRAAQAEQAKVKYKNLADLKQGMRRMDALKADAARLQKDLDTARANKPALAQEEARMATEFSRTTPKRFEASPEVQSGRYVAGAVPLMQADINAMADADEVASQKESAALLSSAEKALAYAEKRAKGQDTENVVAARQAVEVARAIHRAKTQPDAVAREKERAQVSKEAAAERQKAAVEEQKRQQELAAADKERAVLAERARNLAKTSITRVERERGGTFDVLIGTGLRREAAGLEAMIAAAKKDGSTEARVAKLEKLLAQSQESYLQMESMLPRKVTETQGEAARLEAMIAAAKKDGSTKAHVAKLEKLLAQSQERGGPFDVLIDNGLRREAAGLEAMIAAAKKDGSTKAHVAKLEKLLAQSRESYPQMESMLPREVTETQGEATSEADDVLAPSPAVILSPRRDEQGNIYRRPSTKKEAAAAARAAELEQSRVRKGRGPVVAPVFGPRRLTESGKPRQPSYQSAMRAANTDPAAEAARERAQNAEAERLTGVRDRIMQALKKAKGNEKETARLNRLLERVDAEIEAVQFGGTEQGTPAVYTPSPDKIKRAGTVREDGPDAYTKLKENMASLSELESQLAALRSADTDAMTSAERATNGREINAIQAEIRGLEAATRYAAGTAAVKRAIAADTAAAKRAIAAEKKAAESDATPSIPGEDRASIPLSATTEQKVYDGDAQGVLNDLAENATTPELRALAAKLAPLVKNTTLAVEGKLAYRGEPVEALYHPADDAIEVTPEGISQETILHEFVHAATDRVLLADPATLSAEQAEGRAEVERLYEKMKADPAFADEHAVSSAREFSAEVMTNQALRDQMDGMGKGTSYLHRFIGAVMRMLKLAHSVKAMNAVSRIMDQSKAQIAPSTPSIFRAKEPTYANTELARAGEIADRLIAKQRHWTDVVREKGIGLTLMTHIVDSLAPLQKVAGYMGDLAGTQMMYHMRMYGQRMNFLAQTVSNGALRTREVTRADGRKEYITESTAGANLKNVVDILAKSMDLVGSAEANSRLFSMYTIAKRAERVGLTTLNYGNKVTEADLDTVRDTIAKTPGLEEIYKEAQAEYNQYNKDMMQFAVDTGAISKAAAAEMVRSNDYVPYYRVRNGAVEMVLGGKTMGRIGNLKEQPYLQELVGGDEQVVDFMTSAVQNSNMMVDMSLRNLATKNAIFELRDIGMAKIGKGSEASGPDVVKFRVDGEERFAIVDTGHVTVNGQRVETGIPADLLVKGMEGIPTQVTLLTKLMGGPSRFLRQMVVLNPLYAARQVFRDSLAAPLTSGANFMPVLGALKQIGAPAKYTLENRGVTGGQVFTGTQEDLSRILRDMAANKPGWVKGLAKLESMAMEADALTRRAQYNSYLQQGLSEMEATYMSLESMNFSKKGVNPAMHTLSMAIPFFNAQVQALNVLGKAFRGNMPFNEKLKIREKLYQRGMMLAASTIAYTMLMQDDESYKNATPEQRAGYWFIRVPGVEETVRIPIPFEMGYIFKALPEAALNAMTDEKGQEDALQAARSIAQMIVPGGSSWGIPQAFKPLLEVGLGKSFYTGRDLETPHEQSLERGLRSRENTSELAKAVGEQFNLSPIKIDAFINGYGSALGLALVNALSFAFPTPEGPVEATKAPSRLPLVGTLFQPNDAGGIITATYDRMREAAQIKDGYEDLVKRGYYEKAHAYLEQNLALYGESGLATNFTKTMAKITAAERAVKASRDMTPDEKRATLDEYRKLKTEIAQSVREASAEMRRGASE